MKSEIWHKQGNKKQSEKPAPCLIEKQIINISDWYDLQLITDLCKLKLWYSSLKKPVSFEFSR